MGTGGPVDRLGIRVSSDTSGSEAGDRGNIQAPGQSSDTAAVHHQGLGETLAGTSDTSNPLSPFQYPHQPLPVLPVTPQNPHRRQASPKKGQVAALSSTATPAPST